jgi:hypothetical protein
MVFRLGMRDTTPFSLGSGAGLGRPLPNPPHPVGRALVPLHWVEGDRAQREGAEPGATKPRGMRPRTGRPRRR